MRRAALLFVPLMALSALCAGCGQGESSYEFSDIRERDKPRVVVPPTTSSAKRFGYRDPRSMGMGGDPHAGVPGMGGMPGAGQKAFQWKTPSGWEEVKVSAGRDGAWRVKGEPLTDCSLSKLQGNGGGIVMNVNRWRKQMGAPELDAAAVAALPRKRVLGAEAVYVDIPGRYGGGMGKGGAIEDARMLGLLLELPTAAIFLKFTGPAKVVEANQAQFLMLAGSIEIAAHGGGGHAGMQPPTRAPSGRPEFSWDLPSTWEDRKGRGGRVVTVAPKGSKETECYLYLLGGDGGGIDLNINRWRQQMGQKALTAEEIADLERVDALGTKAVVVKIQGPYSGMSGEQIDGALLYGAVMLKDSYLLTAKMRGPASEVESEWDNFIAFCKSVQQK